MPRGMTWQAQTTKQYHTNIYSCMQIGTTTYQETFQEQTNERLALEKMNAGQEDRVDII